MQLLSEINIERLPRAAVIQLLQGDLSAIPAEHAADILVMTAFPGDYTAQEGSLIGALNHKGLSVAALALDKATDLRNQLNCWLSKPLPLSDQQQFNFKKLLCFEPGAKVQQPPEVVSNIFRCINTFAFEEGNQVLIMPVIAAGYQEAPLQKMLPALLQACHFWLTNGLPLDCIKLVVRLQEQSAQALGLFEAFKKMLQYELVEKESFSGNEEITIPATPSFWEKLKSSIGKREQAPAPAAEAAPAPAGYDYFLSYAPVHSKEIALFVEALKAKNSNLSVFYDKDSIPAGGLWIQQISTAIQQAGKVLVFLSPDYDRSPVCWDEFQCAKLMEYNRKKSIIQTVYLHGHQETELPPIMGNYNYIDCREGSEATMKDCVQQLLK